MSENQKEKKDEELVLLSQSGDKQATEELLLRHSGLVRSCARGLFLIGGETEDLIQEGMIGLYHAIGDYKESEGSSFKNFAYLCVRRRIVDAVKTSLRKKNVPIEEVFPYYGNELLLYGGTINPEEVLVSYDERREFRQTMVRVLSDFEFKVLTMYVEGMTCAEICEATGKSGKSVDNAIQRSKRKLQEVLGK